MSNSDNNPVSILGKSLLEAIYRIKDQTLLAIVALIIVLGILAAIGINVYVMLVIAILVVVLFSIYLFVLSKISVTKTEQMTRNLATQMIIAIQRDEYISGKKTKQDFGASLVRAIRKSNVDNDYKKAVEAMAQEFKNAFEVPDSIL